MRAMPFEPASLIYRAFAVFAYDFAAAFGAEFGERLVKRLLPPKPLKPKPRRKAKRPVKRRDGGKRRHGT